MQYIGCPGFLQLLFISPALISRQACSPADMKILARSSKSHGEQLQDLHSPATSPFKSTPWFLCFTSQNTSPTKETKAIGKIKSLQKVSSWVWTSALVLFEAGSVTVSIIRLKSIAGGSCLIWKLQGEPGIRANIWTATLWHRKSCLLFPLA